MQKVTLNIEENVNCIILNWKKSTATAECLKSVLLSNTLPGKIYIVDNNSEDDSLTKIKNIISEISPLSHSSYISERTVWIQSSENTGFAGGNNLALKQILEKSSFSYIWILNNDTEVSRNALGAMLDKIKSDQRIGFVGAPVLSKTNSTLQCYGGGKLISHIGIAYLLGKNKHIDTFKNKNLKPDYIMGCNMLLNSRVIDDIGLLDEHFFMYSEEVDWQLRSKKNMWRIEIADNTYIKHDDGTVSDHYYYYKNRASILFVKKHHGKLWAIAAALIHIPIVFFDKPSIKGIFLSVAGLKDGLVHDFKPKNKNIF